jgi:hypothetical protein
MDQTKSLELVIQELQNRIGQISAQYELQMAILKANYTQLLEKYETLEKEDSKSEDN